MNLGSVADIRTLLPHRYPMLLVDRVAHCVPDERIETVKAISGSEPCYAELAEGLAAEAYDFPAALVLESFVQSAALLWARTLGGPFDGPLVLASVSGVRFHAPVRPGDQLRHKVVLNSRTGSAAFCSGRGSSAAGPVLTVAKVMLAVRPSAG